MYIRHTYGPKVARFDLQASCEHIFTPKIIAATKTVLETVKTASAGPVKPTMDLRCTQDTLFIMPDTYTEAYCVTCTHSHL